MEKTHSFAGRFALLASAFIWGTSFVVLKSAINCIGTQWVLAIRFSISALLMFLMAGKKLKAMSKKAVMGSILMGICLTGGYIVQTYGLKYTTPGKNAFLSATYCVLVPFFYWIAYKKKPGMSAVVAGILCIIGLGFVSLGSADKGLNIGDLLTLCCGIFYAIQIIMMERYLPEGNAVSISAIQFLTGAIICWTLALIFEEPPTAVPASAWFNIMYLAVLCTAACFFFQAWGMQYTPSSTAAVIMSLEAVFGALISIIFCHEQFTFKMLLGFSFIFASVLTAELKPKLRPVEKLKKLRSST